MNIEEIKKKLGEKAADLVENNSIVGLGTGTTASYFIKSLAKKCTQGLKIKAIASSNQSFDLAKQLNINLVDFNEIDYIDLYIDGADEVNEKKQMIKGRGGSLLREKILAYSSKKIIIMIDYTKYVKTLGKALLPVEVTPFGHLFTKKILEEYGYLSAIRKKNDSDFYITDNNNYIIDIKCSKLLDSPKHDHFLIKTVPGVIETGIFIDLADTILIGQKNNTIDIIS